MARIKAVLRKELVELSRERIVLIGLLLGPFLLFLAMGGIASLAVEQTATQITQPPKAVVLYTGGGEAGNATRAIAAALDAPIVTGESPGALLGEGYDVVIVVPSGFDENISMGVRGVVQLYFKVEAPSLMQLNRPTLLVRVVGDAVKGVIAEELKPYMEKVTPEYLSDPVAVSLDYYYRGERISQEQLMALALGVSLAVPLAVMTTAISSTLVAAVSFGLEKEAKTLEKLLTLPITRRELLLGKLAAVALLAAGGVVSYMAGFYIYMNMMLTGVGGAPGMVSFTIPSQALASLLLGLLLTIYVTIVLGFIVGSQAGDVRSSQLSANYLSFILAIPLFPMFFGVSLVDLSLGVKLALSLDPYFLLGVLADASLRGDLAAVAASILGLLAHSVFWTLAASRLLSSEALIVGHPLLSRLTRRFTRGTGVG